MRKLKFWVRDSKLLVRFAVPSMLSMLSAGVYTLVDGLFVGWGAGSTGMAALNVAYPMAFLLVAVGSMIGVGGAINISIARGRDYELVARQLFGTMLRLIIPAALLILGITIPFLDQILLAIGADQVLLPAAREYSLIILCGGIFQLTTTVLLETMRNDNAPARAMTVQIAGLLANIIFDFFFVILFKWGVAGSAWATVLSQAGCFVLAAGYFRNSASNLKIIDRNWCYRRSMLNRVLLSGIPSFGVQLSLGAVILMHNSQALRFGGVVGVAAYAVISYAGEIIILMIQGVSSGIQPVVSYLHGAGKFKRRLRIASYGMGAALIMGVIGMLITLGTSSEIPALFNAQDEVLVMAAIGLLFFAPSLPLIGFQKVSEAYFQAMERHGAASLLIYLDCCLVLPLALLVLPKYFGINGVWAALPASKLLMALIAWYLWKYSESRAEGVEISLTAKYPVEEAT